AALAAARPLGIPVVQTFHALGIVKQRHQGAKDTSPQGRLDEERTIISRAHHIIATCSDEVNELVELGASPRRTTVVPCGVDLDLFRTDGPREERPPGLRRIVAIGRLVERKGVGDVIEALAELPDVELVVAGGPPAAELAGDPEAGRLAALARKLRVASRVDLRGGIARADVPPLLRSADLAVCVPWYEPFGIVPLEAMACGVPVVASAVGGLLDSVVDGDTGIHVPARSPRALAAALLELLRDEDRRRRLGEAGAARARRLYGWDRVGAATLATYRGILARRRPVVLGERTRGGGRALARVANATMSRKAAQHGR
ncbi:MAG: glycosyltransferase, partial [Thermodesulfobacteriota bacterium]